MTDEQKLRSRNGSTIVTFARIVWARQSKTADKIEARFRDVLGALPRFSALEPDREKPVANLSAPSTPVAP